jgi:hypothetical protein
MRLHSAAFTSCFAAALAALALGAAGCGPARSRQTAMGRSSRASSGDTASMSPSPTTTSTAGSSTALSLSALAGRWEMHSTPASGKDSTTTTYTLNARADTTGWTMTFPGGKPIAVHVRVMGDSLVSEAGPFASVRRKGVMVRTHTVMRLVGDRIVGTTTAHYRTTRPDSVLTLRTEGTRAK